MCLTQQEGEVRNILISSQIQQQSLGFLQRHRGAFGDDSDSDSDDDDDDNDNGATFSALPDAYKRGALFSGLGSGQSQPQQQSATTASAGFLKNDEESDSDDDDDDDGAAAFASLPEEYKKGALFAGFGMQQESAAPAAAAAAPRPTSNSADANNDDDDDDESDDDSDIGAAFASLPEEYRRGALFAGLGMKVSNGSDDVDAESDSKLPAVSNATTDDEDVQAKRARLMQQRRRPAEAETVDVPAVPSPPQQVQRVSLSEQDIKGESDDDVASTKQVIGLVHQNTKPFATAASAAAARRTDSSAVVASSSSAKLPSFSFGGHDATGKFDFHFIGTSLKKEISYRSVAKSEADTIGVVGLNEPFTASADAVNKNQVVQVSDEYYTTDAHKDDDDEEDEHDHFHHHRAAVAILSPPIRRTSKEFDEESVVSEMTRLSAMTTFSSDYTCDTVDTAFFLDDISEEGHLSSPSDLDDHEDDEDDDDDSILNEEHLKTLINCATQQLDQGTQGTHHQDACANTVVIPPLSWNNASSDAVAEAVSLTADLFSAAPVPTGRSDAVTLLKEQHAPIVFHTISGATDAASSCCWNHHNAEDVAAFPFCEVEQMVRRDSDGSALGELRKMNWEQLARDVKEEEAAAAAVAEARAKKETATVKSTENEKPAEAAATAAAIRHVDNDEDECCDRSAEQLQKHAHRMTTSHASQVELQKWDAKMGLRRCHCKTMMDTCASRRALLQVVGVHVEEYEPPAVLSRKRSRAAAAVAAAAAVSDAYTGEVASASAVVAVSRSQKQSRISKKFTPDRTTSSKGKEEDQKNPVVKMIHGVPRIVHAPVAPVSSSNMKKAAADFVTSSSHSPSKAVGESFIMNHSTPAFLSDESGLHHPLPKKLKTQADMPSISFNAVA